MSTYTESLGLELITPGSQAGLWGNTTNNSLTLIDQAITGVTPISFASASGTTYTLTDYNGAEDEARSAVLNVTGTASGANDIVIPNKQKTYFVRNSTGQDIVVKTLVGTTPCTVGAGYNLPVFCDGNNNVFLAILAPGAGTLTVSGGGTGVTTFGSGGFVKSSGTSALTASATVSATTELSGQVPVANGGTGASSLTYGSLLVGNGTGAVASLSGGVSGYVATWNGSTWVAAAPASASGVTSFNGRTGAVSPQSTDYSAYYATLSGTNSWTGANSYTQVSTWSSGGYSTTVGSNGVSYGNSSNAISGDNTGTQLAFAVGGTSRMSIYSSYIQSAIPVYAYSGTFGTTGNPYGSAIYAYSASGGTPIVTYANNSSTNNAIAFFNPSGAAGYISTSGTTTNYGTSSDYRLKENVAPLQNALDIVGQLNPVSFTWKANGESATGFIAHEVQEIVPQAVVGAKDGVDENGNPVYQNIDASTLVGILTAAIKELKAEIDALKAAK